jgi:putative peptidoglycan lipid II flippase
VTERPADPSAVPDADPATEATPPGEDERAGLLSSSAVMAAGTLVSRMSGYVRTTLLAAALGAQLHADLFTIGNTIPNMLYILLAGGVFNAVLVPQLVRTMRSDADGGEAYANRVVTLAALFLGAVTALLVLAAPLVMSVYLDDRLDDPALAAQRESAIDFARYCLPQVFFYGMFVLVGQVLNARGRFGPMMWAPIANNVIAVAVLVVYLVVFGPARPDELSAAYSTREELLLGLGSTLGIVAQLAILVPYLRAAGFRYRPRFDFRDAGLGHTLRLGVWTLGFVVVNQVAYTVVVKLASGGAAAAATRSGEEAAGYTVYSSTFLIMMVPHAVVTVSLATAVLPHLSARAAEHDLPRLGETVVGTLRTALALVVPFALLLPVVARDIANVVWGYGAARDDIGLYVLPLQLFAPGLLLFTVHYLVLRGFYALERTRTAFWVQCVIATTNIVAALALTAVAGPSLTVPALVLAYAAAYLVGAVVSTAVLHRAVGGLGVRRLATFLLRLAVAAAGAAAVAWLASHGLHQWVDDRPHQLVAALLAASVALVDAVAFLVLARLLGIGEVTEVLSLVTRRLPGRRRVH